MAEKKQDFVVSDRRRFGAEGELRTDVPVTEEETPAAPPPSAPPPPPPPVQQAQPPAVAPPAAAADESEELPAPPTAEEQQQQTEDYKASGKKLQELFAARGAQGAPAEMTFERLVESFYMTALIQLGAIRTEGEPPSVDIMGARQTIDSLNILQEKTKGNLGDREQTLLQNVLFELRMAWIEITNAIASGPPPGAGPGGPGSPVAGIKK